MTTEEKAKAYDEAIERAKDCLTDRKFCLNKSKTLPNHIYDKEYNYTNEDEKEQEEDYVMHYYGALNRFGLCMTLNDLVKE